MNQNTAMETRMMQIVFPNQVNHVGTLFGGHALEWMDMAASIAATRFTRSTVVTVASDKIEFKVPVKVGELIDLVAVVERHGKTSLTVDVKMFSEILITGERKLCTEGKFTMVAVDSDMNPIPIIGLQRP
ncbi:acyl-CoA thioesterase [Legionella longbeachae]|uniref:Putative thioesterase family protein n=3 Tax=Legionella longbeachae TaxID=450 RepID=D3HN89_LEGLN|nr:acyl-CoA thioesterase [Legionella longbeachae]EEZ93351.1 thioesterase family protein [Legionella longbeachae D-4968]CBJ10346.1 putative thioesterase family protein [Legionella longbeachae NSW150]VEE00875.1 thioesterase [Legionella oakridgensis]HBD7399409.1 acyl-CoA thioesterase [Legionella pneumophila]